MQYHFRIGKLPPIKIFGTEYLIAQAKKKAVMSELKAKNSLLDSNYLSLQKSYLQTVSIVLRDSINIKQHELDSILGRLGSSDRSNPDSASKWKKKADELMTFLATTKTDLILKSQQIDSLENVLQSFSGYSIVAGNAYAKEATKKKWIIENSFSVVKLQFWWLTALAGGSRMNYYTYSATAPFSEV